MNGNFWRAYSLNQNYPTISKYFRTMNKSQIRFSRTLTATWKVLHDPVLTNIYVRKWKRQRDIRLTIYGFVFREMYKAA